MPWVVGQETLDFEVDFVVTGLLHGQEVVTCGCSIYPD